MTKVREPFAAGQFYPAQQSDLAELISGLIDEAPTYEGTLTPKVLIVPHAGLQYSGLTAASAYKSLIPYAQDIKKVVLIGPSHRLAFKGIACDPAQSLHTPLGSVLVNHDGIDTLVDSGSVVLNASPSNGEHSLEVQLPFLQLLLDEFSVTPLLVGDADKYQMAEVISHLWGGPETLIVISTDLSHYLKDTDAVPTDQQTCHQITFRESEVASSQACGYQGLNGFLYLARSFDMPVEQVHYSHSGLHGGDNNRVVGYGAFIAESPKRFCVPESLAITRSQQDLLLKVAREVITKSIARDSFHVNTENWAPQLMFRRATFVSLHINNVLRGCIGSLRAHQPLAIDIAQNAVKAALSDPRFSPVSLEEVPKLTIDVSILSTPEQVYPNSQSDLCSLITPGVDGVTIQSGESRATFLPLVWHTLTSPEEFIDKLKAKADIPRDDWPENTQVWIYQAIEFSDAPFAN